MPLPAGHSSPILLGDRIYLTAFRGDTLLTIAIDRRAGKILWEREAPAVKTKVVDKRNNPASPSPAVEADGIYVFFPDYGLIAYDADGKERWKMPLGPFNNIYGMGASPVIVGDLRRAGLRSEHGSFLLAVDKRTGQQKWKTLRPEAKSGHSTPILWRAPDGRDQILLPGSFLLTAYDAADGRKLWWVRGLSFEMKSTPVIGDGVSSSTATARPRTIRAARSSCRPPRRSGRRPTPNDRRRAVRRPSSRSSRPRAGSALADLDTNGTLSKDEWEYYRAALDSENGMLAIRLGGKGDMTDKSVQWKYQRSVPQLPSPLVYRDVLYMVNDGGIVTTLNPKTGDGHQAGPPRPARSSTTTRRPSPPTATSSSSAKRGAVAVLPPGGDLTPLVVNDPGRGLLRDAGVRRRAALHQDDRGAVRIWSMKGVKPVILMYANFPRGQAKVRNLHPSSISIVTPTS